MGNPGVESILSDLLYLAREEGYTVGTLREALLDAYREGYSAGYEEGDDDGYDRGYEDGWAPAEDGDGV